MSQPRRAWKVRDQAKRTKRRQAKRASKRAAETKRQRTRQQTPALWKARRKGRAVRARPPVIAIPRILPLAA